MPFSEIHAALTRVSPWLYAPILFLLVMAAGLALQAFVTRLFAARPHWHAFLRQSWNRTRRLARFMLALFAAGVAVPALPLTAQQTGIVQRIFLCLFIVQCGWIVLVIANIAMDRYLFGLKLDASDNLVARKAVTQMRILRRAVNLLLVMLTAGFALMSFDTVRQFGVSIFASAGVAGIVAGLAARPLFENLIAGLQLAFTQPIRIDDVVVIDAEWGTVEEIGSIFIVIRLWDLRRQVVPLSYLFSTPFTNWTRNTSSIIGAVTIFADYTLPMAPVRAKVEEMVAASPLWDKQVVNVQVTDASDQAMQVRVLVSASDSGKAWDLRCEVREKLIAYLRDAFPQSLPRVRREDMGRPAGGDRPQQERESAALPPPARKG